MAKCSPLPPSCYNHQKTQFKYERISLKGAAFRLLRLLKGNSDSTQCELFESKLPLLEDIGDHVALSYTWGSESTPCEITINKSRMEVTKDAYLALRDLRYQEKYRVLWIDALCIHQNNEEQGQQVLATEHWIISFPEVLESGRRICII
jgi:hypothetical protein